MKRTITTKLIGIVLCLMLLPAPAYAFAFSQFFAKVKNTVAAGKDCSAAFFHKMHRKLSFRNRACPSRSFQPQQKEQEHRPEVVAPHPVKGQRVI